MAFEWREWRGRLAFLVAAVASVATEQAKPRPWEVVETPTSMTAPPSGKAWLVVLDASHEASITTATSDGARDAIVTALTKARSGRQEILAPADRRVRTIRTSGYCGDDGGCTSTGCEPPKGAFVRIVSIDPVEPFTRDTSEAVDTELKADSPEAEYEVAVASDFPIVLTATDRAGTTNAFITTTHIGFTDGVERFKVTVRTATTSDADVTWHVTATESGYCRLEARCDRDERMRVSINRVR